jgi:hypothetical protein
MKTIHCKAGKSTKIISSLFVGFPNTYWLQIRAIDGKDVKGFYEEEHFFWIFPAEPKFGYLKSSMKFHRRWIDAFYFVSIVPEEDVIVSFIDK